LKRHMLAAIAAAAAILAAGCGSGAASPQVPALSHGTGGGQGTGGAGSARASALHAAAQCIRQHGIPGYADPVLTPSGHVYSDNHPLLDAPRSVLDAVHQACRTLLAEANLNPENEPPAPPQLVQAGVKSAECLRAHGMPHVQDPTAQSPYTPGGGFGYAGNEIPPGGKASPIMQHATHACTAQITAEIQASTIASLSNDG
jgi:hypothetical protein